MKSSTESSRPNPRPASFADLSTLAFLIETLPTRRLSTFDLRKAKERTRYTTLLWVALRRKSWTTLLKAATDERRLLRSASAPISLKELTDWLR